MRKTRAIIRIPYRRECPQGLNSGPLLWNIVSILALNLQLGKNTIIQAYAGNFIVIVTDHKIYGKERSEGRRKTVKFHFCDEKTHMLFITSSSVARPRIFFKLQDKAIKGADRDKVLGCDHRPNQELDKTYRIQFMLQIKVPKISSQLRGLWKIGWGLRRQILKSIYIRVVERIVLYAAEVWWPRGGSFVLWMRLVQMLRPVLLALTRGYRTAQRLLSKSWQGFRR